MKKLKNYFKGFTLVELIIVITILSILATIAFVSFKGYTKNARDGNRIATLNNIEKGLTLSQIKTGKYPIPDNITGTGELNGIPLVYVGNIGENISRNINISKIPKDPLSENNYIYGTDVNKNYYQIATTLENLQTYNPLVQKTYADNRYFAKVVGNYKYPFKHGNTLYTLPSLIFTGSGEINDDSIFIVDKGNNIPYSIDNKPINNIKKVPETLNIITGTGNLSFTGVSIDEIEKRPDISKLFGVNIDTIGEAYFGKKYLTDIKGKTWIQVGNYNYATILHDGKYFTKTPLKHEKGTDFIYNYGYMYYKGWANAISACQDLGSGWDAPYIEEIQSLFSQYYKTAGFDYHTVRGRYGSTSSTISQDTLIFYHFRKLGITGTTYSAWNITNGNKSYDGSINSTFKMPIICVKR